MTKPLFIARQSRHPRGLIGRIVARVMEGETARDNDAAVELLDPAPDDVVADIGTGHGRALGLIAKRAHRGLVIGTDPSDLMVRRAKRRNAAAIAAGRIRIEQASSPALPFANASIDKAMTVHTLYFWPDLLPHFAAVLRALRPAGRFVVGFVPAEDEIKAARFPAAVYRFRSIGEIEAQLQRAGFQIETVRRRDRAGDMIVWIAAVKPSHY